MALKENLIGSVDGKKFVEVLFTPGDLISPVSGSPSNASGLIYPTISGDDFTGAIQINKLKKLDTWVITSPGLSGSMTNWSFDVKAIAGSEIVQTSAQVYARKGTNLITANAQSIAGGVNSSAVTLTYTAVLQENASSAVPVFRGILTGY